MILASFLLPGSETLHIRIMNIRNLSEHNSEPDLERLHCDPCGVPGQEDRRPEAAPALRHLHHQGDHPSQDQVPAGKLPGVYKVPYNFVFFPTPFYKILT